MKKTMEKLNKHFFPLLVVALLLVGSCLPIRASADSVEYLDYADLDYSVKYGTDVNTVTYKIDQEWFLFWCTSYKTGVSWQEGGSDTFQTGVDPAYGFNLGVYPAGLNGFLLENMPIGARLCIEMEIDQSRFVGASAGVWQVLQRGRYLDSSGSWFNITEDDAVVTDQVGAVYTYSLEYVIEDVEGAISFVPSILYENYTGNDAGQLRVRIVSAYVEMDVSNEFWSQFQVQQNGKLLNDMVNGTDEQHAIVNDSVQGMQQAGSKLDGLGDQLNSVEKPDVDDMNVSADKLLGGMAATTMLTAPVLEIWKNPVALSILTVVVTIVLISWVFFGKK